MKKSVNLFLRSRNAYQAVQSLLVLPYYEQLKIILVNWVAQVILQNAQKLQKVFEKLQGEQRHYQDLSLKVNIKAVVQYQGGHLLGFSTENYFQEPAKTVLALIVAPLMGKPTFFLKAKF